MIKFIVTSVLVVLTIIFGCLQTVWAGFAYFALAFGCVVSLMWTIILLYEYFQDYKRENLEEQYRIYCAQLVNSTALTLDLIKSHDKIYYKKFKKTLVKEKLIEWFKIFLCFGIFISLFFVFIR